MRICLVNSGPFGFETLLKMSMNHDGATAGVTFMIWLQKNGGVVGGYPGWGGGT